MRRPPPRYSLAELAQAADATVDGDAATIVTGVATLEAAGPDQLSFFTQPRYRRQLASTRAAAVIVAPEYAACSPVTALVAQNPQLALACIAGLFSLPPEPAAGVHSSASVSSDAEVAANAHIGAQCVVEAGAKIGESTTLGPGCVVGAGVTIGDSCRLVANVTVCHGVTLGQRVVVHPGAVIGSDGFGLANDNGRWVKIAQLGSVTVGDDVEIGANTTIDRGALSDTIIEEGVKLDNQIQVAHNVVIGAHSAIAGCVGIAGSARIGRHCMIGGGVGISGHIEIADRVVVTGMSLVAQSITAPGVYSSGLTTEPNRIWNKISARLRRIDRLARRVSALERSS